MFEKRMWCFHILFMHALCWALAAFRYQLLLLPILSYANWYDSTLLGRTFFTPKVFLYEDIITFCKVYICMYEFFGCYHPLEPSGILSISSRWKLTSAIGTCTFIYNFVTYTCAVFLQFCVYALHAFCM